MTYRAVARLIVDDPDVAIEFGQWAEWYEWARAELEEELRVYELRHAEALSQVEVAGRLEITQSAASKLEHAEDVRGCSARIGRGPVGAPRSPLGIVQTVASEDEPRESIDLESLYLGDMARYARTATFATNWKSVLAVDASIGIVVLLIGLAVVAWVGWGGWILAVAGAIYVGLVVRRFLQWRWIRSQAGLD